MRPGDLKRFAVFADLSEEEQEEVAEQLEDMRLEEGQTLFQEGEEGDGLVLLESGALRLHSGRSDESAVVEAGACLGGISLFAVGRREITATATRAGRVLLLRRAGYRRLVSDCPRAACRLTETILSEVASLARRAVVRGLPPVDPDPRDD